MPFVCVFIFLVEKRFHSYRQRRRSKYFNYFLSVPTISVHPNESNTQRPTTQTPDDSSDPDAYDPISIPQLKHPTILASYNPPTTQTPDI